MKRLGLVLLLVTFGGFGMAQKKPEDYNIAVAVAGRPPSDKPVLVFWAAKAFTFCPSQSKCIAESSAFRDADVGVYVGTRKVLGRLVATLRFEKGEYSCAVSPSDNVEIHENDFIRIMPPLIPDLTLGDIAFTLAGARSANE